MPYDPRTDPKYKDNKLLLALTHQESRFNPNAVSPTGARGLTQVLPSTAKSPGFGIAPNPNALTDPEQNMAFGASYLDAMKKRYKGDVSAALVAYNGGPGTADNWIKSGKNDKVLSKETSNYYKSVLSKAGEGYDFSKVKVKLPAEVPDDEDETEKTTGFAKLKRPGAKSADAIEPSKDAADEAEEDDKETTLDTPKVKKTKKGKEEDDDDDDEEDDEKGSKKHGVGFEFDADAPVPKLKEFESPEMPKLNRIMLGNTSLLGDEAGLLQLPQRDDPRTR